MGRSLVVEMWLYPDGSRILELSTKCLPAETFHVAATARVYLGERGIHAGEVQQTKTRTALDYFSAQLAEEASRTAAAAAPAKARGRSRAKTAAPAG
jgi:hypothetical protein